MEMISWQYVLIAIVVGALIVAASWVVMGILGARRDRRVAEDFYSLGPSMTRERPRRKYDVESAKIVDEVKDQPPVRALNTVFASTFKSGQSPAIGCVL